MGTPRLCPAPACMLATDFQSRALVCAELNEQTSNQPTIMTAPAITSFFEKITLGAPQKGQRLTVIPVLAAEPAPPDYLPLVEALQNKTVEITEVTAGG